MKSSLSHEDFGKIVMGPFELSKGKIDGVSLAWVVDAKSKSNYVSELKLKNKKYAGISSELKDTDYEAAVDLLQRIAKFKKRGYKEEKAKEF